MKPEDIKAGRRYLFEGVVNGQFGSAVREVISIDRDKAVVDIDGKETEVDLSIIARLAVREVTE